MTIMRQTVKKSVEFVTKGSVSNMREPYYTMKRTNRSQFKATTHGDETVRSFVPSQLPPTPPVNLTAGIQQLHNKALLACGRLDAIRTLLPNPTLFLYFYVRREAVLSSQIEGTQSSLSDLMLFETDDVTGEYVDDVLEVSNYVSALQHGTSRLNEGFPLCGRLLKELHAKLLASGRGAEKQPGTYRCSQNWIGGTRPGNAHFVPPPPQLVQKCMSDLDQFLNDNQQPSPLILAALAHAQFETIHPFLDGNGRVGRLLISLVLHDSKVLSEPLLYLSLYLKQNRSEYYKFLDGTRGDGDWESWIEFFLRGVEQTANNAVDTAQRLNELFARDRGRVEASKHGGVNVLRAFDLLGKRGVLTSASIVETLDVSKPTANRAIRNLVDLGILRKATAGKRNCVYVYGAYIAVLSEGAEA